MASSPIDTAEVRAKWSAPGTSLEWRDHHPPECWKWHHTCAIHRLCDELDAARARVKDMEQFVLADVESLFPKTTYDDGRVVTRVQCGGRARAADGRCEKCLAYVSSAGTCYRWYEPPTDTAGGAGA